jgi:hypothetical protein
LIAFPAVALALLVFGAPPASAHPTARTADRPSQASTNGSGASGPIVVASPRSDPGSGVHTAAGRIWEIQNCDGRYEDFRVADNNSAEHRYQLSVGGPWTGWSTLGGTLIFGDLGASRNGDCKIEVFGTGTDFAVWTTWQTNPGAGPWASWASLHGQATSAPWTDIISGTLAVCALGTDDNVWCNRHTQPYGSPWTGWFRP